MAKLTKQPVKTKPLTPEELYWQTAEKRAKFLIAQQINQQIPFNPNLVFELTEAMDDRYWQVMEEVQDYYTDEDNEVDLPEDPRELAQTICGEYLTKLIADLQTALASWQ